MMSTILFIQANPQHSSTASRILSRIAGVKQMDIALIQEPWYCEGHILGLNIPGYTLFCGGRTDKLRARILVRYMGATRILL